MKNNLERVGGLLGRISTELFGTKFVLKAYYDKEYEEVLNTLDIEPRVYIQAHYDSPCTDSGKVMTWNSGKHYLSTHMTDDEIVKRAWVCYEMAVKHEVMESFKVDGKRVFNPHTPFTALMLAGEIEVKRD